MGFGKGTGRGGRGPAGRAAGVAAWGGVREAGGSEAGDRCVDNAEGPQARRVSGGPGRGRAGKAWVVKREGTAGSWVAL